MCCENPEFCRVRAARWKNENNLKRGEERLQEIRDALKQKKRVLEISKHVACRQTERSVSIGTLRMLINKEAWPFCYSNVHGVEYIGLIGYVKISEKGYRPLHIIIGCDNAVKVWQVVTVYDPRTQAYKWSNEYQERICFCKCK